MLFAHSTDSTRGIPRGAVQRALLHLRSAVISNHMPIACGIPLLPPSSHMITMYKVEGDAKIRQDPT